MFPVQRDSRVVTRKVCELLVQSFTMQFKVRVLNVMLFYISIIVSNLFIIFDRTVSLVICPMIQVIRHMIRQDKKHEYKVGRSKNMSKIVSKKVQYDR